MDLATITEKILLPFKRQRHIMVKYTQTIRRQQRTSCLSVFDYFVGLVFKGLLENFIFCVVRKKLFKVNSLEWAANFECPQGSKCFAFCQFNTFLANIHIYPLKNRKPLIFWSFQGV